MSGLITWGRCTFGGMLERELMGFEAIECATLGAIALISPTRSGKLNPIRAGLRAEFAGAVDRADAGGLSRASSRGSSRGLGVRG